MTTLENKPLPMDAEVVGSRIDRIDPNIFTNQIDPDEEDDDLVKSDFDEETTDAIGEHDHHQDDNYALGGHVTRSGGL